MVFKGQFIWFVLFYLKQGLCSGEFVCFRYYRYFGIFIFEYFCFYKVVQQGYNVYVFFNDDDYYYYDKNNNNNNIRSNNYYYYYNMERFEDYFVRDISRSGRFFNSKE